MKAIIFDCDGVLADTERSGNSGDILCQIR